MFEAIGAVMIAICICSSAVQIFRISRLAHLER